MWSGLQSFWPRPQQPEAHWTLSRPRTSWGNHTEACRFPPVAAKAVSHTLPCCYSETRSRLGLWWGWFVQNALWCETQMSPKYAHKNRPLNSRLKWSTTCALRKVLHSFSHMGWGRIMAPSISFLKFELYDLWFHKALFMFFIQSTDSHLCTNCLLQGQPSWGKHPDPSIKLGILLASQSSGCRLKWSWSNHNQQHVRLL